MTKDIQFIFSIIVMASFFFSEAAFADLIPPHAHDAAKRLYANSKAFDIVDSFCTGKLVGDECAVKGDVFSGGGSGVCNNSLNQKIGKIELTCVRSARVTINRGLPDRGFVHDADLCEEYEKNQSDGRFLNDCTPLMTKPVDRFCTGRDIDSPCTAILSVDGQTESHTGQCKEVVEVKRYYNKGYRVAKRTVIQCEPPSYTEHTYSPASWWQRLTQ